MIAFVGRPMTGSQSARRLGRRSAANSSGIRSTTAWTERRTACGIR